MCTIFQVWSKSHTADHDILVDGTKIATTREYEKGNQYVAATTSFIYQLNEGQKVSVDPFSNDKINGAQDYMTTWFGMHLLQPE